MKLTFKDLKQQKFLVEAEPSDTIASLKEKISAEKGWEVAQQKLIYSGKILQDQNTIQSYDIEEKGFIVCMISKPKVTTQPATTEASSSSVSTPKKAVPSTPVHQNAPVSTPSAPVAVASRPPTVPETPAGTGAAASAPEASASPAFNDPSALTMGAQREAAIQNMLEMGYEREAIDRAMRAAFYNPDRAVEYLLTGIPEHLQERERPSRQQAAQPQHSANPASSPPAAPAAAPAAAAAAPAEGENVNLFEAAANAAANAARQRQQGGGAGAGGGLGNLEFLRSNPQFQQLRQVVQQQPQMLEPILQQVSQGNPGLASLINQNQEAFLQLLGEGGDNDDQLPPGTHQVVVTEEERQAIERLCRLGFERDLVIQAYFAFDKNEELAANFLFEQPDQEDE